MAATDDIPRVRMLPPVIYLVALAVGFLLQWAIPFQVSGWQAGERILGWVLIAIGIAVGFWAVALFRLAGTSPNPMKPTTAFVVRGPYRFTRNPMYVGFTSISAGVGLVTESLWVTALALVAGAVTRRLVIDQEERYLERKFGSEYRAYTQRVRRWV